MPSFLFKRKPIKTFNLTFQYIISSADCVHKYPPESARLGEHDINEAIDCGDDGECNDEVQEITINTVVIHPEFDVDGR